ncbi:Uncharacterised protein [Serratia plymuthica]|nr:Uncharacterised protein [Serratia plymuthica]
MYKKIVFMVFILTLFGFKMSILGQTGDDGGSLLSSIRIDDIVIVLFLIAFILKGGSFGYFLKQKTVFIFMLYIMLCIFSSVYNSIFGQVGIASGLLFSLRPLEYFMYITVGFELARLGVSLDKPFKIYVFYCLLLIAAQMAGVIGGFSNFAFNRAIANTGGPWELAAVSAFLACYFFHKRAVVYTTLSVIILLLTQSRITLVATIFMFVVGNFKKSILLFKIRTVFLLALFTAFGGLSYLAYLNVNGSMKNSVSIPDVASRVESFFNKDTFSRLNDIYIYTDAATSQSDYFDKTYGESLDNILSTSGDGDASAFIRFTRWVTLIKTANNDAISFIIGLGPSYAGKAVDGNYVRLFAETGIMGLFLYVVFLLSILLSIKDKVIFNYTIILGVTAIFIDIFVTHKAMFLFWVLYGYYLQNKEIGSKDHYRGSGTQNENSLSNKN